MIAPRHLSTINRIFFLERILELSGYGEIADSFVNLSPAMPPHLEHLAERPITQLSDDVPDLLRVHVFLHMLELFLFFLSANLEYLPKVKERHVFGFPSIR